MDFLQKQPIPLVLGNPKLLALSKDNPKLWEELLMAVGGQFNAQPRDGDSQLKVELKNDNQVN